MPSAHPLRSLVLVAVLLAQSACAGAGLGSGTPYRTRNVLTRAEMDRVHASNAFDAVQRLRSRWLRVQGTAQMPTNDGSPTVRENPVWVYMDDQRLGTVESLSQVEIAAVQYIRYYKPVEAGARWGFNHAGGVIYVSTRPVDGSGELREP